MIGQMSDVIVVRLSSGALDHDPAHLSPMISGHSASTLSCQGRVHAQYFLWYYSIDAHFLIITTHTLSLSEITRAVKTRFKATMQLAWQASLVCEPTVTHPPPSAFLADHRQISTRLSLACRISTSNQRRKAAYSEGVCT